MIDLKPCPFCGEMPMGEDDRYMCSRLGCVMQEETISAKEWNTRPIEDALNARIAELEEKQRWIPVSEKLPEETGLYLVWQDGSFAVGYRVLYYSAGRSYLDFMWSIVTHWMPLPARPEVQE